MNNRSLYKRYLKLHTPLIFILLIVLLISYLLFFSSCRKREPSSETVSQKQIVEETQAAEAETEEEIPQNIQSLIDEADSYFKEGEYSLAAKTYRDAILAIQDSDLSKEKKEEIVSYLNPIYEHAKEIVDTARMHHGNAMQLQYEKRFEEAIEELKLALEIYPKYQPAIDALETLEALKDLK
ncbi:MAG: hypothetical protein H5T85_07225 [Actinobacteria bacterium]|nr:hypothetical protein [Actinomycetota bacterium]